MHKLSIVAVAITAAITLAPVPVITGAAQAGGIIITRGANPPNPNHPSRDTYNCSDEMGYLRRVYEEQLDQVEDANRVWVRPVCMGEDYGLMRADGNAGALRAHIADNDAMTHALFLEKFRPEDVVGIKMIRDDTVILFVHPFFY